MVSHSGIKIGLTGVTKGQTWLKVQLHGQKVGHSRFKWGQSGSIWGRRWSNWDK